MKMRCLRLMISLLIIGSFPTTQAGNPQRNGPQIGDYYQGGVVYWIDQTKNGQHGLIVDISSKGQLAWSDQANLASYCAPGNTSNGPYAGRQNTINIMNAANCGATGAPAAYACFSSKTGGFNDWYLPSAMELTFMIYQQLAISQTSLANGGTRFDTHVALWSSTEYSEDIAWSVFDLSQFISGGDFNKRSRLNTRCVRAF